LPCGWSQDGLHTFNELAKEISKDPKEHGEEFKKAFKKGLSSRLRTVPPTRIVRE
jgi:hypothetical protein